MAEYGASTSEEPQQQQEIGVGSSKATAMGRGLRLAFAMAVAAVVVLGQAPSEAAKASTLTLTASGSTQGVLKLTGRIHFDPSVPLVATTAGHYAGYYISDLHGQPVLGRLEARASSADKWHETDLWSPESGSVPPGTYRVTVITDAHAVIRIPLSTGKSASAILRTPATAIVKIVEPTTPATGPTGSPAAAMQVSVPAGSYRLAAITQFIEAHNSPVMVTDACFSDAGTCARSEGGSGTRGVDLNPYGVLYDEEGSTGSTMAPFTVSTGTSAVFNGLTVGLSGTHAGLVLLLK